MASSLPILCRQRFLQQIHIKTQTNTRPYIFRNFGTANNNMYHHSCTKPPERIQGKSNGILPFRFRPFNLLPMYNIVSFRKRPQGNRFPQRNRDPRSENSVEPQHFLTTLRINQVLRTLERIVHSCNCCLNKQKNLYVHISP
jgi:hypothetical protein